MDDTQFDDGLADGNSGNDDIEEDDGRENIDADAPKDDDSKYWNSDDDYVDGRTKDQTLTAGFVVPKDDVLKYWNGKTRTFIRNQIGQDWPQAYGSPCPVVFKYCHAKKYNSAKRMNHFAKITGQCKVCQSKHVCLIDQCPFDEQVLPNGEIRYIPKKDMMVDVTVTGQFHLNDEDQPDITKPKHNLLKATGLHLKGKEREHIGEKASKEGVQTVFMEQFDDLNDAQLKSGNKTSIKSYNVVMMARQEYEKKQRCGDNFYQSVQNIMASQHCDVSLNFDDTKANRDLAGFVRSAQETPFKIVMANFDQLRIGSRYLNNDENATIFMDSSGKILRKEKGKDKLLNTAVVIPPPARGHSPFPIFEMVSEKNKTIDFISFLQYGMSYLSTSVNNENVRNPRIAVSDFSFANIHSILEVFNKVKIAEYIATAYKTSLKNEQLPFSTILTICENHFLPSLLLYARSLHPDKMVSDTFVAGMLKLFEADSIEIALKVFKTLVDIHCSREISAEARENIRESKFDEVHDYIEDFGDEATAEDDMTFGSRKGLRINSPYFKLFNKIMETSMDKTERKITNKFYAPKLLFGMTKQYLSLFPLFSASMLPDKNLRTNSYIELYWKDQRRILNNVPNRLRWPPRYLGDLHAKIRRDAKSILSHSIVPNLKLGGKVKAGQADAFKKYTEGKATNKTPERRKFIPSMPRKKNKTFENESFGGTSERWDSQRSKDTPRRRENYMKGKDIDHEAIIEQSGLVESLRVTGSRVRGSREPEVIVLNSDEIEGLVTKNSFISSQVVDSGLILLDKRFNEESNMSERICVYTIQSTRLILSGVPDLVKDGRFIAILPRDFGLASEPDRYKAIAGGQENVVGSACHYTLVSNLQCDEDEVNVYETFEPFRTPEKLLTETGKKMLKILAKSKTLRVNCVDVKPQLENECGAITLALAVQLCFYHEDEGAIHHKMINVRDGLLQCLRLNRLNYFQFSKVKTMPTKKFLFSFDF